MSVSILISLMSCILAQTMKEIQRGPEEQYHVENRFLIVRILFRE